jgi:tRNA-2-methylthio-N6-dimethylallyladenosine synthase
MKKYYIITIGCQMNKADSERIAGRLEKFGLNEVKTEKQADLVVVTTCGVRQSAEDKAYGLIAKIKKQNPKTKIILAGCLSERADVRKRLGNIVDLWLPAREIPNLKRQIANKLQITNYQDFDNCKYLNIAPKYNSKFSAYVPIGNGCNNFCSYCVVPYARGREVYRPADEIISEVKKLVKKGYKEIILIAQNVNSYLSESKKARKQESKIIKFSELLSQINHITGDFWIRFATSHPKDMSDELIDAIAQCDKVCKYIHLPAQAGNNKVLKAMNRKYTIEHYQNLIKKIRRQIPDVSITTDIIVGFPGETKEQFNDTVKLFKAVKFDMAYIAQYSPRPRTVAEKMIDNVPKAEKKRREEALTKILSETALRNNRKYLGKTIEILVDGKTRKGEWLGKTRTFKVVVIKTLKNKNIKTNLLGVFVKVSINSVRDFGMEGALKD